MRLENEQKEKEEAKKQLYSTERKSTTNESTKTATQQGKGRLVE